MYFLLKFFDNDMYRLSFGGILTAVKILSTCIMICLYRLVCRQAAEKKRIKETNKKLSDEVQTLTANGQHDTATDEEGETVV